MLRSIALRRGLGWAMALVLVVSLLTWWVTRERLPPRVRIATAMEGGQYHQLAALVGRELTEATGLEVELVPTAGSGENRSLLLAGEAELALVQAGAFPLGDLAVLAPVHRDVVHVVVRRGQGFQGLSDLVGRRVLIGPPGSGMRESALAVLRHYRLADGDAELVEAYFLELEKDESLDAAIITSGLLNPDTARLLGTARFELLPLDAEAISTRLPYYLPLTIPRGLFAERPPVPAEPVLSVGTTALLVGAPEISPLLVREVLSALYRPSVREALPTLIGKREAQEWAQTPLHPEAAEYYDPFGSIGTVANFMESLAAAKELLFALVAATYLLWTRWTAIREAERAAELRAQKDRLDAFVDKTLAIERAQMTETDRGALRGYLDKVTRIKLEALEELSHEDLRGDRMFLIFLTQCASLSAKIQNKIESAH